MTYKSIAAKNSNETEKFVPLTLEKHYWQDHFQANNNAIARARWEFQFTSLA